MDTQKIAGLKLERARVALAQAGEWLTYFLRQLDGLDTIADGVAGALAQASRRCETALELVETQYELLDPRDLGELRLDIDGAREATVRESGECWLCGCSADNACPPDDTDTLPCRWVSGPGLKDETLCSRCAPIERARELATQNPTPPSNFGRWIRHAHDCTACRAYTEKVIDAVPCPEGASLRSTWLLTEETT